MIVVPATSPEDWKRRLTDSDGVWQPGNPAHDLAARWCGQAVFPPEIAALFDSLEPTRGATLLLAFPEHHVPLARGAQASQTDLWLLARTMHGLVSVVIEGGVNGSFGPTIGDRPADATAAPLQRWAALCDLLEIDPGCDPSVRHRLLHRTTIALLEARRFFARTAAVIVHSFSRSCEGFGDFQHFVAVMGGIVRMPGELIAVAPREGIELFFGWAQGPVSTET